MIFADTSAFLARYNHLDRYHPQAAELWRQLAASRERALTSNFVIGETLTLLMRGAGPRFAADRARELYSSPTLVILRPAQEDETAAVDLMVKHAGARIGFTDCVSFVLMRKAKIQRAFSFDAHFAEAGFILCP